MDEIELKAAYLIHEIEKIKDICNKSECCGCKLHVNNYLDESGEIIYCAVREFLKRYSLASSPPKFWDISSESECEADLKDLIHNTEEQEQYITDYARWMHEAGL